MLLNLIHEDTRGKIFTLTGLKECEEITIFETRKGYARGGCIHTESKEHIVVAEGSISFYFELDSAMELRVLRKGDAFTLSNNTPHFFTSIEDSVVMEWGPKISEKQTKFEQYRQIVDHINSQQ